MSSIIKKPSILSIGLAAYLLGLFFVLRRQGSAGHFAGGFFMGLAIVLLIGAHYLQHQTKRHLSNRP